MFLDPKFYLRIFWTRLPIFLAMLFAAMLAGFILIKTLPTVYRAQAILLVENSQIPTTLATSTVSTDLTEQIQIIQQRLMTRENLLDLAHKFDLYADQPDMQPDEIVESMRDRIDIYLAGGRGRVTTATISAEASSGAAAAGIVNELVTRALGQDAAFRTEVAADTLTFFKNEVARLGDELSISDKRILDFKNENVDALPETQEYRLSRQSQLQERLAQTQREMSQLSEQRRRLVDLFESTGRADLVQQRPLSPEEQELRALQSELREALAVFSTTNPKVVALQNRVNRLEAELAGAATEPEDGTNPRESVFRAQLVEIDSQLNSLETLAAGLEVEIEALRKNIEQTPSNAITLNAMERDRDNVQIQYDTAVSRLSQAATGERIEVMSKGQRLSVIERADIPTKPAKPRRLIIAAGAVGAGLFLGAAMVLLLEFLHPKIRQPSELTKKLGITPLGTLPFVEPPRKSWGWGRRRYGVAALAMIVLALVTGLLAVDQQLLPLEQLAEKIMAHARL